MNGSQSQLRFQEATILADIFNFGIRYIATSRECFVIALHVSCLIQKTEPFMGKPRNSKESGILRIHDNGFPLLDMKVLFILKEIS